MVSAEGLIACLQLLPARRVHFQTDGGTYGFTLLEDWEYVERDSRPSENIPDLTANPNDP